MRSRLALIWILGLGFTASWLLSRGDRAGNLGDRRSLLEERLPVERIDEVEIVMPRGPTTILRRSDDRWEQVLPFPVGIDSYSARQLITTAASLQGLKSVGGIHRPGSDSDPLGLVEPSARITWKWDGGSTTLNLGDRTLAGRAWASVGDSEEAWLVDAALHERIFDMDQRLWRDGLLLPDAGVETRSIGVQAGDERLTLERGPSGWMMRMPVDTRADSTAVEDWLARLSRTRALGYLYDQPGDLTRYGLEPPVVTIELRGRLEEQSSVLLLGDPLGVGSPDRYGLLEGSPTVLRLGEDVQRMLVPATASLVDPTGTAVVREDVARIEVRHPDGIDDFTLEREFEGWNMLPDEQSSRAVDRIAVERLLGQLTESRANEIAFGPYPVQLERAVVVLYGFDGGPLDTVRVIREGEGEGGRWALENGDGVLRIHPVEFNPLIGSPQFPTP